MFQRYRKQVDSRVGGRAKLFQNALLFSFFQGPKGKGKEGRYFALF